MEWGLTSRRVYESGGMEQSESLVVVFVWGRERVVLCVCACVGYSRGNTRFFYEIPTPRFSFSIGISIGVSMRIPNTEFLLRLYLYIRLIGSGRVGRE